MEKRAEVQLDWVEPGLHDPAWIGVDLDGTLAHYEYGIRQHHVGEPIWPMVERVKIWLEKGIKVKIFTARWSVLAQRDYNRQEIMEFFARAGLPELEITCIKDYHMIELWDDRAVTVEANTGQQLSPSSRHLL